MRARLTFGLLLVAALFTLAPGRASAAPEGRYWTLTPVAGWAQFSDKLHYPIKAEQDQFAAGARLGLNLNEWWALEGSGLWSPPKEDSTDKNVSYLNFGASLLYTPVHFKVGAPYFALGGGYSQRSSSDYSNLDNLHYGTFEQAVGWTSWLADKVGLRLEARNVLNIPQKNWGQANKSDQQYLAGLTFAMGGTPKDTDGDGVVDKKDKCPGTPAGAKVDVNGCPIDSDGDGVYDGLDKCPNTAAGAKVDADGCPIVVTERETELLDTGMIRLQGVNFETGKSDILPESFGILDDVGAILRKWPTLQIEVGGHTDSRGTASSNQSLSEARANAVREYLLRKFPDIQAAQMTAKGYGESKPIAPNKGVANLAKNRRVEFVVLNKDVLRKEIEHRRTLQK